MDFFRYQEYVEKKQYDRVISCINIKTAWECLKQDPERVFSNVDMLCGPKTYHTNQKVVLETDPCRIVITRNGHVVFHFHEGVDVKPMLRSKSSGIRYTFRNSCFNELCWLPLDESPINRLKSNEWLSIARYLSIEDKRVMRLVNKSICRYFDKDAFWYQDVKRLETIVGSVLPFKGIVSLKQCIFRTLMYIDSEELFVQVLTGQLACTFAKILGIKVYGQHCIDNGGFEKENARKRARQSVVIRTNNKKTDYTTEAKLAIGYFDNTLNIVVPLMWITTRGKLRYMTSYRKTKDTWKHVKTCIQRYRSKLLQE